jgi:hypothetical protein
MKIPDSLIVKHTLVSTKSPAEVDAIRARMQDPLSTRRT